MWWPFKRKKVEPQYHANGVPVGLYQGDPIEKGNITAIFDRMGHMHDLGTLRPGDSMHVTFRPSEPSLPAEPTAETGMDGADEAPAEG